MVVMFMNGVASVPIASGADCVATIGVACGGQNYCCVAGSDWCIARDCSR